MLNRRNRAALAIAAGLFVGCGLSIGDGAVHAAEKAKPPKPAATDKTAEPKKSGTRKSQTQDVFKPKEKISAGKPVSFPSDI